MIKESEQEIILQKLSNQHIRVAVVGNVDSGKSTLIGSLVSSSLDDGRGMARSTIMKHKHELTSGRTSTIGVHVLGLDDNYQTVSGSDYKDVVLKSNRLVSLMDLAGHEKYLKTTIEGISRGMADYALVLVNASQPPTHMTIHHLKLCSNMGIPVIVLLTKADRSSSHVFQSTKKEISRILKSHPDLGLKRPFAVKTQKDIELVQNKLTNAAVLVPMISISCVTGEGMDVLQQLLANLPQRRHHAIKQRNKPFEFLIEDIYHQVPGVGTVISGFVSRGEWNKGEALYIGPLKDGTIFKAIPKSTHVAQSCVDRVWAGHSVCFAIPKPPKARRLLLSKKGMVAMKEPFQFSNEFVADIYLTKGQTVTIQKNRFAPTIQLLHNKVTGKVVNIVIRDYIHGGGSSQEAETIRPGDRATVTFQVHKHRPAFVRPGMRVILREGHVLGYGIVLPSKTA